MSRVDLSEFLDAYLGEADELLAGANAQLLAIDPLQRRGESTARQVRELFRALHTIKGLSAMVGVEPIVTVAHRMEGALRTADRAGGRLSAGAVDVLFQGIRAIEQQVASLAAGRPIAEAPVSLLEAIERIEAPDPGGRPRPDMELVLDPRVDSKLASADRTALQEGVVAGRRAICAMFVPSPDLAAAGTTITSVRERLAAVGEIVRVLPISLPTSPAAPGGLGFALLTLTDRGNAEIAAAVGLGEEEIATLAEPGSGTGVAPIEADEDPDDEVAAGRGHVRVDVERLDDVLEGLSALIVGRATLAAEVARLAAAGMDVRGMSTLLREQQRQVRTLRSSVLRLRMVPVSEVLSRVPLILRGLRRTSGKSVRLEVDAGRTELDKAVAERVFPAIVHLVRNAVDHGLEEPEARHRAGKSPDGLLRIVCRARGNGQLELRITDDGAGVDGARLAARAGRPVPTRPAELLQLLCLPGLSAREDVSATSGRGMGMDIARKVVVEELGGELQLETTPGVGTTFVLRIPLTISIVDAFTFESGGQRFVVPLSMVDEIVEVEASAVSRPPTPGSAGAPVRMLERRGEIVPLVDLCEVFGMAPWVASRALIVRREGDGLAFGVDRVLGQQEIVVRPLEDPLVVAPGIAGATDLGDGKVTLVVDLFAIGARIARRAAS